MTTKVVSWPATNGARLFGQFVRWEGDFAICKRGTHLARIYKANLTFEGQ